MRRFVVLSALVVMVCALWMLAPFRVDRTGRALLRYPAEPDEVVVPVVGVDGKQLRSSFGEPRSEHRSHKGIDIFAPRGCWVVAAADGEVVRVGQDRLGGNVVWVAGAGARLYYYAHLDRFRPELTVGEQVHAGTVLGFVGNTGNARTTPPHLHFAIYPSSRAFRAIDPAPLLRTRARSIKAPRSEGPRLA